MSQGVGATPAGTHTWPRCLLGAPPREAQTHREEATQTQTPILPSPWVGIVGRGVGASAVLVMVTSALTSEYQGPGV